MEFSPPISLAAESYTTGVEDMEWAGIRSAMPSVRYPNLRNLHVATELHPHSTSKYPNLTPFSPLSPLKPPFCADCFAKLHSWSFEDTETVTFSSKFMHSYFYNASVELNDIWPAVFFGVEEPRFGMKDRMSAIMHSKPSDTVEGYDNLNVNLWDFGLRTPDGSEKVSEGSLSPRDLSPSLFLP